MFNAYPFRQPFHSPDGSSSLHRVYRNGKVRFWLRPRPQDPSLIKTFEEAMCRKGIFPRKLKKLLKCVHVIKPKFCYTDYNKYLVF